MSDAGSPVAAYALHHLDAPDGARIALYAWPAPAQPKAVVQISHGMAEHVARYSRLAGVLSEAGYAVYGSDHRGHGQSVRDASELGYFAASDGFSKLVDDMYAVNRHVAARHPSLPRVLLAHSFGSFVAQEYLFKYGDSISAVALSGTTSNRRPLVAAGLPLAYAERVRSGPRGKSAAIHQLTFGAYNKPFAPQRTDFDWLSRDPAEVDKYVADPRCGFELTVQGWIDLFLGLLRIADPANQRKIPRELPIYIFSGTLDPVGEFGAGAMRLVKEYERAGLERVSARFYAGARHEVLNETNRDEVTGDLIAWLNRTLAR